MTLIGIIGAGPARVAIVMKDGESFIVGVGDRVGEAAVMSISRNHIVLKQRDTTFVLQMIPEDASFLSAGAAAD